MFFVIAISLIFAVNAVFHAHCGLEITVNNTICMDVYTMIIDETKNRSGFGTDCKYSDAGNEFCGYIFKETTSDLKIHLQHETPVKHYVDDIYFQFQGYTTDKINICKVNGLSQSETISVYDYDTNYCNIFNLFRNGSSSTLNYNISIMANNCPFHPKIDNKDWNPSIEQCNKY